AKKLAFALNAIGNKDTVKPVVALIDSGKVPKENVHGLYLLLAQIGGPEELKKVLHYAALGKDKSLQQSAELLQAVEAAIRTRKVAPPRELGNPLRFSLDDTGAAAQSAMRIIGLWKLDEYRRGVLEKEAATTTDAAQRAAAMEGLALFGDERARQYIKALCSDPKPEIRRAAITAFASLDLPAAAAMAAEFLTSAKPEPELLDLFSAFLSRKAGIPPLAKALAAKKLDREVAKIGVKAARASGQKADDLVAALTKAGNLAAARKPPTAEEVKALVAEVTKADAARGELVYRRADLKCLTCHAIGGAGGVVGPDMTSIGASAQTDYLVESLLIPSKAIKEGFHATRVVTADEKVYLGIKVREADGVLVLRTAEDKEVTIPVKDIAERPQATTSLMPEGLTEQLTQQEFADLVAFLSQLGKVGTPYAPNKARLVRRWQVIEPSRENLYRFQRTRVSAAAEPENPFTWSPVYSMVSGDLPVASLPKFTVWNDTAAQSVVRFQLDV
ncbi:MAG TPA: HEAT repeat domain-containing protein, partial [Gemmata sp.]|nr:HEAT repeat domain-containing protein [Gemmata sp.]